MTRKQKPESAGFRTHITLRPCPRCASSGESTVHDYAVPPHPLAGAGTHRIKCENCGYYICSKHGEEGAAIYWNLKSLEEAEQRRKDAEDAEGAEPVAWLISDQLKGKPGCAHIVDRTTTNRAYAEYQATLGFDVTPLYTRPTNVTALIAEAVAAERERCIEVIRQHGISPFPIDDPHPTAEAINATLQNITEAMREGGEHG